VYFRNPNVRCIVCVFEGVQSPCRWHICSRLHCLGQR
jgi:hypothetical protein